MYICICVVHWGNDLLGTRVKLASSSEMIAGFNTELQRPSGLGEIVFLISPCFHGLSKNLNTLQRWLFYMFSFEHVCVWFSICLLTQACCTYACVVRMHLLLGYVRWSEGTRTPVHTTLMNTATRACCRTPAECMCYRSVSRHAGGDFLCLRKEFAFGLTLLVHFRKLKLKYPQKDESTEHGILSWSSALNRTFHFLFVCFHLPVRDTSFLA